jgi:hypothetical protein
MNWPGFGDPYYTPEGGVRKDFYAVVGVPNLFVNGDDFEQSIFQEQFDEYYSFRSKMDIAVSHQLTGSVMNVRAAVIPYSDYSDLTVHIVVVENITTGNVGNNGETEFHNVMMKMMPDAFGLTTSFTHNTPFIIDETTDMSTTYVEELDDLSVIVFVQNNATKEVFQSALSVESENILLPPMNLQAAANENNINLTWTAPESSGLEGYNIYRNGEQINSSIVNNTEYLDLDVENGIFKYTVTAVYNDAESIHSNSSTVEMCYFIGIGKTIPDHARIFPNPAGNYFIIKSATDYKLFEIYKISGQLIYKGALHGDNLFVNTQAYKPGMYLVKLSNKQNSEIIKITIK